MLIRTNSQIADCEPIIEGDTFQRLESNVQSYANNFPAVFCKASGTEIWDTDGKRYLDFLSGAGSLNYGHNHPVLKSKLLAYISSDYIGNSLDLHTESKEEFLEALDSIILRPRGLDYVTQFCGPTGTNAVEAALKLARKVTGRTNVVTFTNGFHGMTLGALAATGNQHNRNAAGLPAMGVSTIPYDGYLGADVDTTDYLSKLLNDPSSGLDLPAAVLVETVQGEGGHNFARNSWLKKLEKICRERSILLIVDEIQTGCGRTGSFFSFETAGIKPDIVTVSKSISGYGLPFAITLIKREHDEWKPGEHNGTFRGNNLALVTATATLQHFWANDEFEQEISSKAKLLGKRLEEIRSDHGELIAEVRGRGMMQGIAFRDPGSAQEVSQRAFAKGLIAERVGPRDEVIKVMMPLTTPTAQFDEGLSILASAVGFVSKSSAKDTSVVEGVEFGV